MAPTWYRRRIATDSCLGTDTVVAYVEGRAGADDRARIAAHASRCAECRELLSAMAREEAPRTVIGRYLVERLLGAGGMGRVYAAYDPELGRSVAVKLLRGVGSPAMTERLRREAQAMAQIAHPNVLPVHDVGTVDDQIFIVMELVNGETLARWTGSVPEILAAYRAAGEGLAAVHRAGIVHRDFKPDNVLRGSDGRIRVADFGLAASGGASLPDAMPVSPDGPTVALALTASGAVVGTPMYMAPEQHDGRDTSARSDQFSFCVALFVALYGARPFAGDTLHDLRENVAAGAIRWPAKRIPRRVRRALRRGLSADPAARFPSMDALLAAIAVRRRTWVPIAGAVAAGSIAAFALTRPPPPCRNLAAPMHAVWPAQLALATTPASQAAVVRELDRYSGAWIDMRQDACEATRIAGDQTEGQLELRTQCLDQRLAAMTAAISTLAAGDRAVAARAVAVVQRLPPIADCADLAALAAPVRPPPGAARAQVAELRDRMIALRAQADAGIYAPTLAAAIALQPQVTQLGYRPLEGTLGLLIGGIEDDLQDLRAAKASLEAAALASEAGRDDRAVASALIEAIGVTDQLGLPIGGLHERAVAVLEKLDHPPRFEAQLAETVGIAAIDAAQLDTAERGLAAALAQWEKLYGKTDLHLVSTLQGLAYLELQRTAYGKARDALDRALAIQAAALGTGHPDYATSLRLRGDIDAAESKWADADAYYAKAQQILEAALGPDTPAMAELLISRGSVADWQGQPEQALALAQRAVAIDIAKLGRDHRITLSHEVTLASTLESAGKYADARLALDGVAERMRERLGPDHQLLAYALETSANIALGLHDYAAARDHASEAMAIYARVLGDSYHPWEEQRTLGEAQLGLGDNAAALATLEAAHAQLGGDEDAGVIARLEADLGRARVMAHRPDGLAMVQKAWSHIATDDRMESERAALLTWAKAQRVPLVAK